MSDFNREPITIIEIDQDTCGLNYGESPCVASIPESTTGQKCFNTYSTCQDRDNYDRQVLTLRFVAPHASSMIFGINLLPLVMTSKDGKPSVKTSPTMINIGGANANIKPLGRRESVTIKMRDMPYNDAIVDPYRNERKYNPEERGTFWSKWIARNPYHQGRNLRVLEGLAGQPLNQFKTRHYIIDTIEQPGSAGTVTIKAFDILRKTDGEKAKYPYNIDCKLVSDINATQTTIAATGTASDFSISDPIISYRSVRFNDEVIEFASVSDIGGGLIQFNGCIRGASGSEASDHSADDDGFRCVDMAGKSWRVASWLLKNPSNIPDSYIDDTEWDEECSDWIGLFNVSRRLTESIDVNKMLSELCQQSIFYIWQDIYQRKIRIKPMQFPGDDVVKINDTENIIEGSYSESIDGKAAKTQVWVFFSQRDVTGAIDDDVNYKKWQINRDSNAESENQRGEPRIMKIYSPWIHSSTQAIALGSRILGRYSSAQRISSFEVDFKDDELEIGTVTDITHRNQVDIFGAPTEKRFEVISRETVTQGQKLKIKAQIYDYGGDVGLRYARICPNDYPANYDDATQAQRENGFWICENNGKMPNGDEPYRIF